MKKIIIILTIFLFYNVPAHSDKLLKNGFLNNNMDYAKEQNIINPKDKIILIYNHGQDDHDKPSKKTCVWKNGIRNFSSLVGKKVDGKKCFRIGINNGKEWKEKVKKYHDMDMVDCFQYYNQTILDYIAQRVSS